MAICKECGFISYPAKYKTKEEILAYYKKEYRPAPTVENLYTGQRKLIYHTVNLDVVFKDWIARQVKSPVVLDIGAAFGMFLHWLRHLRDQKGELLFDDKIDLNGVELTENFVRNAWHEYGLTLKSDFDESKRYDLIATYKVLEHQIDPDWELERYWKVLKDDGYLYVSVPTWWHELSNPGVPGFALEYYYHPDHINIWSRAAFTRILSAGFEPIYGNTSIYDLTYVCRKKPEYKRVDPVSSEYKENMKRLDLIKKADEALQRKEFKKAIDLWPNFPIAWRGLYEYNRADYHKMGYERIKEELCEKWLRMFPDSFDAYAFAGDVAVRYQKYDDALKYFEKTLQLRPKNDATLQAISNIYRLKAKKETDEGRRIDFQMKARDISRELRTLNGQWQVMTTNWIFDDNARIPVSANSSGPITAPSG